MNYWKIIFVSFLIGCITLVVSLIVLHSQQPHAVGYHPANDMVGLAYGLAIGFNIVLALCSLPVLVLKSRKVQKRWHALALLFALPLVFAAYVTWELDFYALLYCLPYLFSVAILFIIRITRQKTHAFPK